MLAGNHFTLVVLDRNLKEIQFYNSLPSDPGDEKETVAWKILESLQNLEKAEVEPKQQTVTKQKLVDEGWKFKHCTKNVPLQTNFVDCGVFVSMYAFQLTMRSFKDFDFTQRHINSVRQRMRKIIEYQLLRKAEFENEK